MSGFRRLAEVLRPIQTETPYGGRSVSYDSLGPVWLDVAAPTQRDRSDSETTRMVERTDAVARADPRLTVGLVLRLDGRDWVISRLAGDPKRPGRVLLGLEQGR